MKALISVTVLALLMLAPMSGLTSRAEAQLGYEWIYVVYWDCGCPVGPPMCNEVVGEWLVDCNEEWIGSGWMPGEYNCTYYTLTRGNACPTAQAASEMPLAVDKRQDLFANSSKARKSSLTRHCPTGSQQIEK